MTTADRSQLEHLLTNLSAVRAACLNQQIIANRCELITVAANCSAAEEHLSSAVARVTFEIEQKDKHLDEKFHH